MTSKTTSVADALEALTGVVNDRLDADHGHASAVRHALREVERQLRLAGLVAEDAR